MAHSHHRRKAFRAGGTSYLLDDYGTGAAAAYSLRVLSSSFASSDLIEVREDGGDTTDTFTAAQITDGALATFCGANNGFIRTWHDQSGNANDATQTTLADQPQIVTAGVVNLDGGKPCVTFDGANHWMKTADGVLNSVSHSFFSVHKTATAVGVDVVYCLPNNPASHTNPYFRVLLGLDGAGKAICRYNGTVAVSTGAYPLTQTLSYLNTVTGEAQFDGSSSFLSWTGENITYPLSVPFILGANAVGAETFNGNMQEVVAYSSNQTTNRTAIETEINAHYSIY